MNEHNHTTIVCIVDELAEPLAILNTLQMLSAEAGDNNKTVQLNAGYLSTVLFLVIKKIEMAQQKLTSIQ